MLSFKQYLLEYDSNIYARKLMQGYSYAGQEPELRSDEDAEKTKQYVQNLNPLDPVRIGYNDKSKAYIRRSGIDAEGRPTGYEHETEVDWSDINADERDRIIKQNKEEEAEEVKRILARWKADAEEIQRKKIEANERLRNPYYDQEREDDAKRFNEKKRREHEYRMQRWNLGLPQMEDLA